MSQSNEFDSFLSAWKSTSTQLATKSEKDMVATEPYSENLENLYLGLRLLQEVKATHSDSLCFIEPLHADSSKDDAIQGIQKLAEQAMLKENDELQDACLLTEDALSGVSADEFAFIKAELLSALNDWSKSPEPQIIASTDPTKTEITGVSSPAMAEYITRIEKIAAVAVEQGYTALNDISLFIVEALRELSSNNGISLKSDLPSLLDNWSVNVNHYLQNSPAAVESIMAVLRHPDLNIPFEEEEFEIFSSLLLEDIATKTSSANTVDNTPAVISNEPVTPVSTATEQDNEPAPALSAEALELVELLDTEAGLLNYRFLDISPDEATDKRQQHVEQASEELDRLANAANMVGFEGLALACAQVKANLALFAQDIDSFTVEKRNVLTDWVSEVKAYLTAFNKTGAGKQLLTQMTLAAWPQPLPNEAIALLLPQMQVKNLDTGTETVAQDEKIATDEDISLALPDDVNKELLDLLLQELPGYTQQFSEAIQRLHAGGSSKDIDVAQRIAHTIKGSANTVGIKGIAMLTHQMEDILMACAKVHKQPSPALIDTLMTASDCLEAMCESLLGFGDAPSDSKAILQEVLHWAYQIATQGIQDVLNQDAPVKTTVSTKTETPQNVTVDTAQQVPKDNKTESAETAQVAMVRVPTDQIENLFRLSGESIILNGQVYERQRRLKNQLQAIDIQFSLLQQLGAELERLIDLKDLSGRSLVNNNQDFDNLEMDQYNELHTASRRMVEASVDARAISADMKRELEHMNEVLEYQQRLVINTQEAVMQTRFVPVGSIGLRLQRGLRQTCRLTGKQGELTLLGENLLIDGDTLNALVEPLMHLLRNAVDHGLESETDRIAVGKPPVGRITIEFDREGNSILVRCRDDGRGLNFDAIRRTAETRGDLRPGETIDEETLKSLILRPNFSTTTELTQTSGRGVGMDVVNFQVLSLGGSLALHSVKGQGLTVELRMPLPLSRSHALLANVCHFKVAISSKGITQIIYSQVGELKTISNEQVLVIENEIYPVVKLEDLLHVEDRRRNNRKYGAVLLVQNQNKTTAVLVSSITDSREVVIKNLGHYMNKIHGFVGATILGDGTVTPVLDIPELLRAPVQQTSTQTYSASPEATDTGISKTRILVVDDSLSQRRALEQILTDAGFRVHAARDGIEAAEWLVHSMPAVVVTDLEMPRMNGIELAAHIRTHANIKHLPIIMITSRSTQKHRQMAEEAGIDYYLVKPVQDDDLLTRIQTLIDKQASMVEAS